MEYPLGDYLSDAQRQRILILAEWESSAPYWHQEWARRMDEWKLRDSLGTLVPAPPQMSAVSPELAARNERNYRLAQWRKEAEYTLATGGRYPRSGNIFFAPQAPLENQIGVQVWTNLPYYACTEWAIAGAGRVWRYVRPAQTLEQAAPTLGRLVPEAPGILRAARVAPVRAAATVKHHPLAEFLGGDTKQVLSRLDRALHGEFHSALRPNLKSARIPLNVGGRGGSTFDWARYMRANPGAQRQAFDAVLDASRYMDVKYGTSITHDVWQNIMNRSFTPYP
jgi:hypothetical protein